MSVQVSHKKQLVFLILLTLIFLIVVEVLVNIWLYFFYTCDFADSEIFENVDKRKEIFALTIFTSHKYMLD